MNRLSAIVLGAALLAGAANAAEFKVSTVGKSPTELRAAVSEAAFKACKSAYAGEIFADYERDGCVKSTVKASLARVAADQLAAARAPATTLASR